MCLRCCVCGERGLEGGDVGISVCCVCLKLMPFMVIMKEKKNLLKMFKEIKRELKAKETLGLCNKG